MAYFGDNRKTIMLYLTSGRGDCIERSSKIKWQSANGSLSFGGIYLLAQRLETTCTHISPQGSTKSAGFDANGSDQDWKFTTIRR